MGFAGVEVHISPVPLVYPFQALHSCRTDRAGHQGNPAVGKGSGFAFKSVIGVMQHRLRPRSGFCYSHGFRHSGSEDSRCIVIGAQALVHIQPGADKSGVVGISQRIVRYARLFYAEVLHCIGQRFLVFVSARLDIVDELKVDPVIDPIPVKIVDDDILFKDAAVIAAPGEKRHIISAEFPELLQRLGKAYPVGKPVPVKSCDFFYFIMNLAEVYRPHVNGEFLSQRQIRIQFYRADLNDLPAQVDGQFVENR